MASSLPVSQIKPGNTLLIPSGKGNHLFVSVLDTKIINGQPHVLLVPFCTARRDLPHFDDACIILANEHPFVTAETFIEYKKARQEPIQHVLDLLDNLIKIREDVSSVILARIRDGLGKTKYLPRHIKSDWGI